MVDREKMLNVRMAESELEMLKELAEARGLSQSDTIRQLVREAHRDVVGPPNPRPKTIVAKRSASPAPKKR